MDPKEAKPETKPTPAYEEEVDYGDPEHDWENCDPPDYGPDYGEGFQG